MFMGILAIIPFHAGEYYTDGLAIKILSKKDKTSDIYYELLKLTYSWTFNTKQNVKEIDELEKLEYKCLNFIEEPLDNKVLDQEIITHLLFQLVTLNIINEKYTRCIQLIQPFITKKYLKGISREEVIISYLYAKLAIEHKIEEPLFELNFNKSIFHVIPKIKYKALLLFSEQQKSLAITTLESAKKELLKTNVNLYNNQQDMVVIDKFIEIMENN